MYRGFNVTLDSDDFASDLVVGKAVHGAIKNIFRETLDPYLRKDGILDATKMQANWFPQVQADVFISHAHKDEDLAIALAGWLYKSFELFSFIDSCAWGHSNALLKAIDKEYCYNANSQTYDYDKRNYSTSHVHIMLATALTRMMDNCECLFFLNTPASITVEETVRDQGQTLSPWIYHELAMSQLLRPKKKTRENRFNKYGGKLEESLEKSDLQIIHRVDLSHLNTMEVDSLIEWRDACQNQKGLQALDVLYELRPPRQDNRI
ncbi:hypothetical protein [Turneriella parva]|uniref:TIR domain-containing protein n=1 Tax=Turneriella parva (strain ATCC BAA-1111 / DSM 21527 / NCTC 11395 / H) TaxID=869212 RepID=I4BAC9_TURPD|nr:hypothetical protein [Turneriella parva]AFM14236.1 hypothetical protein Turpa_3602 [Turneriella parva DSM 21527]